MKKNELTSFVSTILAVLIGGIITFSTQHIINKQQRRYDYEINNLKSKVKLYEETIDVFQVIINDLKPNLTQKIKSKKSIPITDKFSNIMNQNILYFNEKIGTQIETIIKKGYWNMTKEDAGQIMKAMVVEIKNDKKNLNI